MEYCRKNGFDSRRFKLVIGQHQQWHHYAAEWGADVLFTEGNCDLPNDQVRTAIIRGAARQYGREWFEYYSAWGGVNREITWFDESGALKSGITPSLSLRQWIAAFYSGCRYCNGIESPASQLYYRDASGRRQVSEFGRNAKKFSRFVFKRHPDRGTPCVPVALMLEHDHGWTPRDHRVFGGSVPYTRAGEMIDNFFNAAFPGQEADLPNQRLPWRHDGRFPWRTHQELFAMEREGKFDHRVYEKGVRTDSTWGDSFDVVLENCPLEALLPLPGGHPAGRHPLASGVDANPARLCRTGRHCHGQYHAGRPGRFDFLGVEFWAGAKWFGKPHAPGAEAYSAIGRPKSNCAGRSSRPCCCKQLVAIAAIPRVAAHSRIRWLRSGGDVQATGPGPGGVYRPALHATSAAAVLHPACADLIDHLMQDLLPVAIRGPEIEFMINILDNGLIVTLMHNGPDYWDHARVRPWKGGIDRQRRATRLPGAGEITVAEWWTDRTLPFRADGNNIAIPWQ